ncbi:MAG TPA: Na-translocating system protein MpsC family protein [Gaiellaceae bacterium]|nr:Na-translocating system protein MpsC family protein [Gaiellaceae bacterium]
MVATNDAPGGDGKRAAAISNAISGLHREYYGRGARRTRTVMGGDYVVCLLDDVYTPVERTLIDAGRFPAVRPRRQAFQQTMRGKFTDAVEGLTGREVVGFLSEVHVDPDLSVETFIPAADSRSRV